MAFSSGNRILRKIIIQENTFEQKLFSGIDLSSLRINVRVLGFLLIRAVFL